MKQPKKQHSHEYQILLNNIPGGVQQCLNDEYFTMVEVNQGFLGMFGYTREELITLFQDRFAAMIHPDDLGRVQNEVQIMMTSGEKLSLQYRVLCKDGSIRWVEDIAQLTINENGEERIFCVLIDITESRMAREELRLTMERHQIILDQTTDVIFEWDMQKDRIIYSGNWYKKFGYTPQYDGLESGDEVFCHIFPADVPVLRGAMATIKGGDGYAEVEIRIQHAEGRYIWCRIRATAQYDGSGRPFKAVGIITDIDTEKKMIDELRRRAERDALTGLYNREETERRICGYLEGQPEEVCALFMIDTDNFKQINDSQGHVFGDAVLAELAAGMRKLTRQSDVVGRIGGDEFAIFLKNISSRDAAAKKAEDLIQMFRNLFQEDKQFLEVSCSVGVAVYPEDGKAFADLYHSADLALYQAKSQGKNRYVMLDAATVALVSQRAYSSLGAAIDSNVRMEDLPENLVNYVFQVLYDTRDFQNAIQLILEIVGKRFDVSRAYIFESSEDGMYASNTFEWCNDGIAPEKDNLQNLPYEKYSSFRQQFDESTILYCRDIYSMTPELVAILEPQGVRSLLHCAIVDNGRFYGFVGFDECTGTRMWNREEIGMLSLISQLITTFLLKNRATERDAQVTIRLNTMLDTQNAYIYVIERATCQLVYMNQKTQELDPVARPGMTCYHAFFNRDAPCENCPLVDGNGEIFNPRYRVWTKVEVSPMKWGEVDAYLVSCFDVTEYKNI